MWWPIDGWKHIRNSEQQTDREACSKLFPNQGGHCCSGPNKILKTFSFVFLLDCCILPSVEKNVKETSFISPVAVICVCYFDFSLWNFGFRSQPFQCKVNRSTAGAWPLPREKLCFRHRSTLPHQHQSASANASLAALPAFRIFTRSMEQLILI